MSRQATRDTSAERTLRAALHTRGLRYRIHVRPEPDLRRIADIVFTKSRVAVFVDGCFWHGCPEHATYPRRNGEWWAAKLARNKERDAETNRFLSLRGWTVIRVWEHEAPEEAAERIARAVKATHLS